MCLQERPRTHIYRNPVHRTPWKIRMSGNRGCLLSAAVGLLLVLYSVGLAEAVDCNLQPLLCPFSPVMNQRAPETFQVTVQTTAPGTLTIHCNRTWSPLGVDRFFNLVRHGFYNDTAFFRTIAGFVSQWGISGTPKITAAWSNATIANDPIVPFASNVRGAVSFAAEMCGNVACHRTTQLFVNYADNSRLDAMGFTVIGMVSAADMQSVVDRFFSGYGEAPDQELIAEDGNGYLKKQFPLLTYIAKAWVATAQDD